MQRCQGQPSTLAMAPLRPSCASETQSCTPARPRARRLLRNSRQKAFSLGFADVDADDLAPARLVHAVGDDERLCAHAARFSDALHLGVQPKVRVGALQGALAEAAHLLVEGGAEAAHGAAADAGQAERRLTAR